MRCISLAVTALVLAFSSWTGAQVVISEVMSNPKGKESGAGSPGDRNEYVELYNSDSAEVDIEGWVLWDGDGYDRIEAWIDTAVSDPDVVIGTTVIGGERYAVILDPEYTHLGDTTFLQPYDFPPGTVIMTVGNTTIGDGLSGTDPLSLGTPDTNFVDTYGTPTDTTDTIPFDAGDGISIERIDLHAPDREDNWAPCQDSMGTPGRKNSVTGLLERDTMMREGVGLRLEAHPNPFSGQVIFLLLCGEKAGASIWICDVTGRRVTDFGHVTASSAILWRGSRIPPGIYFCVAEHDGDRITRKVVKMR